MSQDSRQWKIRPLVSTFASAFVLAAASSLATAQCPIPDNLDGGPCCERTELRLPEFPRFSHRALDICFRGCDFNSADVVAEWSAPVPARRGPVGPVCGLYLSSLTISDPSGNAVWRGRMRLTYSRTWLESGAGTRFQVWRFLVNSDMVPSLSGVTNPCGVPNCAAAFGNRVRYTGYVDYAQDCVTGEFSTAWMLNHDCGRLEHLAGFPRAGNFHPGLSFTFVGPSGSFAISPAGPVENGGTNVEVLRRVELPSATSATGACIYEEPLRSAFAESVRQFCLCGGGSGATRQYNLSTLRGHSFCGTIFDSSSSILPGLVSKGIGSWTDPNTYPGVEYLRWNIGSYVYTDRCTDVTRREVFYGVSTFRGFDAFQLLTAGPGVDLPETFVDQGNSIRFPGNTTTANVTYVSDHIINFNF